MSIEVFLAVPLALIVGALLTHVVAERSRAVAPVWASFLAHLLISFAIYAVQDLSVPDAFGYDDIAQGYVHYWNGELSLPPGFALGKEGWVLILAVVYFVVGHVPLIGLIINATASAMTTSLLMGVTSRIGRPDRARVAGWLSLFPQFLFWGSLLLRESLAWMLIAASLWAAAGIVAKVGSANMVVFVSAFAGMMWIRGTVGVVLAVGVALGIILTLKRVPPVFLAGAVGLAAVGGPLVARALTLIGGVSIEGVNAARASLTTAGSGFATTAYSDPVSLVLSLPNTFSRALLGPFAWELPSLPTVELVDVVAWLILLVLAWRGWKVEPRSRLKICVIPALCLLVVVGATSGNYGTMIRLRAQAAILLVPMAAVGWRRKSAAELVGNNEVGSASLDGFELERASWSGGVDLGRL